MGHAASAGPEPYWEAVKQERGGPAFPQQISAPALLRVMAGGSCAALVPPVISPISLSPLARPAEM